MSWNFTSRGRAKDVAAEVAAMPEYVPQGIKDLVKEMASGARDVGDGMEVISHGHHGGNRGSIGNVDLKINAITLAKQIPDGDEEQPSPSDPKEIAKKLA